MVRTARVRAAETFWKDQQLGLREIERVLRTTGCVVIADHFATGWLRPFFAAVRKRDRMHTRREVDVMLRAGGLTPTDWRIAHTVPAFLLGRPRRHTNAPSPLPLAAVITALKL